ncbi:MAG: hypothetical protein R6V85_01060 [Polyangia bacterium]
MAVLSLVLGILAIALFSWGGPLLGFYLAEGGLEGSAAVHALGWSLGVAAPLIAVALGVVGLRRGERRVVSAVGVALGGLGALAGVLATLTALSMSASIEELREATPRPAPLDLSGGFDAGALEQQLDEDLGRALLEAERDL